MRVAIASAAAAHGAEPVEDERPGLMEIWHVGEMVAMVRQLPLEV